MISDFSIQAYETKGGEGLLSHVPEFPLYFTKSTENSVSTSEIFYSSFHPYFLHFLYHSYGLLYTPVKLFPLLLLLVENRGGNPGQLVNHDDEHEREQPEDGMRLSPISNSCVKFYHSILSCKAVRFTLTLIQTLYTYLCPWMKSPATSVSWIYSLSNKMLM